MFKIMVSPLFSDKAFSNWLILKNNKGFAEKSKQESRYVYLFSELDDAITMLHSVPVESATLMKVRS